MSFELVSEFENKVAKFFGAPYGVAVDSCTHAIELCLRYVKASYMLVPCRTYVGVPMLAHKLNIELRWVNVEWQDKYLVHMSQPPESKTVWDAAVLWQKNSYIKNSLMCLSFQYQKHLKLGRGGMILTDNAVDAFILRCMSYDGRDRNIPWRDQNIAIQGYHYYMTPETAALGIGKLPEAILTPPRKWTINDWPDVSQMRVFQ